MKLWRCVNEECEQTGYEFESDSNRCPHCKMIQCQELVYIHYLVPAEGPIKTYLGNRMIACSPKMATLPKHCTGVRMAVSCPACKASVIFVEDERDGVNNDIPWHGFEQRIQSGKL